MDRTNEFNSTLQNVIQTEITNACNKTENMAKNVVPVDTGRLRDSITTDLSNLKNNEGEVGTTVPYALYVELGTVKMGAQPYLFPTAYKVAENLANNIILSFNASFK